MHLPLIIGHRGASFLAPENTLSAINLAWELGVEAVEVDVRMTQDHQIVVFHDADTLRLSGKQENISDNSFRELEKLDIGQFKGANWKGEHIALLSSVLATIPPGNQIFIEVKGDSAIISHLIPVIKSSSQQEKQIHFLAFDPETAGQIKKALPKHFVYLNYKQHAVFRPNIDNLIQVMLTYHLDGVDISVSPPIQQELVERIHQHNKKIFVWVVNDVEEAKRLTQIGVDGIITDRPAWLRKQLLLAQ